MSRVEAVVLDVGETIISEERIYGRWADHLGVPRFDFFAVLGSIIERGGHHREVFTHFAPDLDVDAAMADDPALGAFDADDLYPDARPCLQRLHEAGFRVGLAGNQPEPAEAAIDAMELALDFVAASQRLGVEKPSPGFFAAISELARAEPAGVAYVGDRVDNDVIPAMSAGMVGVFIRRGPWGEIHSRQPDAAGADLRISSLDDLPRAFDRLSA